MHSIKKTIKLVLAMVVYHSGLFSLFALFKRMLFSHNDVVILMYHCVFDHAGKEMQYSQPGLVVSERVFDRQMSFLTDNYNLLSLENLIELLKNNKPIPKRAVVITFDDGWRDNYLYAYPILKKYRVPATIFLSTDFVGTDKIFWFLQVKLLLARGNFSSKKLAGVLEKVKEESKESLSAQTLNSLDIDSIRVDSDSFIEKMKRLDFEVIQKIIDAMMAESGLSQDERVKKRWVLSWDEIMEMSQNNIDFGSHGCSHQILTSLSLDEAERELIQSKKVIEERTGKKVSLFSYPNGDYNSEVNKLVQRAGYSCAVVTGGYGKTKKGLNPFTLTRVTVREGMSVGFRGKFSRSLFAFNISGWNDLFKKYYRFKSKLNVRGEFHSIKNILHLTETSGAGGSETVLAYIAKNLGPKRYRSSVCLLNEGWLSDQLIKNGVNYTVIENKRSFDPIFLSQLIRLIKREKIDLVHAHEFMMNVYGSVAARICFVPMIGTIHSRLYFTEKRRRILAYKLAMALCSRMVTVSEDLKMFMCQKLNLRNRKKILTIDNGIDLKKYAVKYPHVESCSQIVIPPGTLVGGTVGSLFEVKGISYLLEATREVVSKFPNFRLLIAGEGDQESVLKQKMMSMGLQETVNFLGFRNDIPELLNLFDIYICSSISEGLSLSILEAMAAGKPVVATQVGGNPELVIPAKNGFLVPPGNPSALAEKILILLKDKNLRERMGKMGREMVEEKFSLEKMIENYQNLYEKLLA